MICLSKDGLRTTEATGFVVNETLSAFRYYKEGEFKYNNPGEKIYCLYANNGFFMDAYKDEIEAKEKLREAMKALATGLEIFEF